MKVIYRNIRIEVNLKERTAGKTYGTIAKEAGKLDEFKVQSLEQKKVVLDQRVKDGLITQDQADAVYNNIKNNQSACDGTGNAKNGRNTGMGFGWHHMIHGQLMLTLVKD